MTYNRASIIDTTNVIGHELSAICRNVNDREAVTQSMRNIREQIEHTAALNGLSLTPNTAAQCDEEKHIPATVIPQVVEA